MSEKPFATAVRAAISDSEGRCLLVRRSDVCTHWVGRWEWPGGKVDEGETFDVALRREIMEETGLEVQLLSVLGAYGLDMAHVRVAVLCLDARVTGGKLCLDEDHDDYAWVPAAEVPNRDLVDGLRPVAEGYAARQ